MKVSQKTSCGKCKALKRGTCVLGVPLDTQSHKYPVPQGVCVRPLSKEEIPAAEQMLREHLNSAEPRSVRYVRDASRIETLTVALQCMKAHKDDLSNMESYIRTMERMLEQEEYRRSVYFRER